MDGQLSHALATSLWGDRWLTHESSLDLSSFEAENQCAALVYNVDFVDPIGAQMHSLADWAAELRRQGVTRLRLVLGDGNPGYAIYAHGPAPTVWVPTWGVGNFGDPHGQIWSVRYTAELLDEQLPPAELTVEDAIDRLRAAVAVCQQFTRTELLPEWETTFDEAATLLKAAYPAIPGYGDLVPPGTPGAVRRLLAAAVTTRISGPMDRWPSLTFDDPRTTRRFHACAAALRDATDEAFVAATAGERRAWRSEAQGLSLPELPGFVKKLMPRRGKAASPDGPVERAS